MIYRPRIVALLFAVAAFSQLAPTTASYQECISASVTGLPVSGISSSSIQAAAASQCPNLSSGIDCTIDATSLSTNGDTNFASKCAAAGGEVYDTDMSLTCQSQDADGVTKTTLNNVLFCAPKICTVDDIKTLWQQAFQGSDGTCTVAILSVTSGSMAMSVSTTTLFVAMAVGIFSLIDTLV